MANLESQYKQYLDDLSEFERVLTFDEWVASHEATADFVDFFKDEKAEKFDDLVAFLEYEEAYTVDPNTQKRIRTKLVELDIWPPSKLQD